MLIISYCTHSGLRHKTISASLIVLILYLLRLYLIARIADCDNSICYQSPLKFLPRIISYCTHSGLRRSVCGSCVICIIPVRLYLIARIADCDTKTPPIITTKSGPRLYLIARIADCDPFPPLSQAYQLCLIISYCTHSGLRLRAISRAACSSGSDYILLHA